MAYFALLWKARTIENYRLKYEKEKINSIVLGNAQLEQTLSQRWRLYRFDTKKRISRFFKKLYPDGSVISNFFLYLMTDQTFPNFLLKSVMGFVGGIILTYLCFMFFVFQLAISLMHATIMSSIIGVLLTLGLAFSYRIRCLVFLLIPQFFSRVGRYTLTCYALVLILTGPATNTLKNSEVLSESMACSQEQIKTSVHQINDLMKKPINTMKDSLKLMVDQLKMITAKVKETVIRLDRLVLSIVNTIQSSFSWLQSIADLCNAKLGTPYDRCNNAIQDRFSHCQKSLDPNVLDICDVAYVAQAACYSVKPFKAFCYAIDFMDEAILASVKKKLRNFTEHLRAMFQVEVHIHHSYSYSSNTSRSASQVAAGIVTEIRNRADPMLTWLSWSSCVTSLFLLLIIFRAKYYQHMYETRYRFDNRYVTKELQALDLKRQQQGRETVLPLNRRERGKYITPSSFYLVASEKVYLNRSAVFMAITTFKLLIHMVADYSLYWVLMTIRCHGRFQSDLMPGIPHSGAHVSGSGFVARLFSSIIGILDIPLSFPAPSPISCLPDPYPPDLRRYTQIGVLIFLLWFFALFEPYGLRLRHLIMGHYRPERAKARATWLYNHILRTRGSFMKFARRKLHREYKHTSDAPLTFRQWISDHVPFQCLRSLVGLGPTQQHCLLCGITSSSDPDSRLTKCQTPGCPGVFCISCFADIGELCTICLTPADYGDLSDVSLEKGSSDDSDSDGELNEGRINENITTLHSTAVMERTKSTTSTEENRRWSFFKKTSGPRGPLDTVAWAQTHTYKNKNKRTVFTGLLHKGFRNFKRKVRKNFRVKKRTLDWVVKLTPENKIKAFSKEENHKVYSNTLKIEKFGEFNAVTNRTKSIGVNTNRNRGVLVTMIMNSFISRKGKPRIRKKAKQDLKQNKQLRMRRIKDHTSESGKRTLSATKPFHLYNFTICQRNFKSIVRSNKEERTKNRMKGHKELKGIMRAIRHNSNDIKNISNQNNGNAPNNCALEDRKKITKVSDNANFEGKNNKKKCSKDDRPEKSRKKKDINKINTKNSRNRIAEFHKFFSNHWNNFKYVIMRGNAQNRSDITMLKEKKNHKRRKKRKGVDLNETDIEKRFARKDIKQTRNLRISAFLAELEWTKKRGFSGKNKIEEENDSFLRELKAPPPINTYNNDKIVGMVQLKSMPFQWRETPRTCTCHGKKCICRNKQSATRLFVSLPKLTEKLFAKENFERFRNKVKVSLSMVPKVSNSVFGSRGESPFICESSICLTKRSSLYRSFSPGWSESDVINTDLLYENAKYDFELMQDSSYDIRPIFSEESSKTSAVLEKEIVVSRSTISKEPIILTCSKCNIYDDLQRKWDHVKKNFTDSPGTRNPLSMLKNFCSSIFKLTCDKDTCPKRVKKDKDGKQNNKAPKESPKNIESSTSGNEKHRDGKQKKKAPKETENEEKELKDAKPKNTSDGDGVFPKVNKQILTAAILNVDVGIQTPEKRHKETQRTAIEVETITCSALVAQVEAHKCTKPYPVPETPMPEAYSMPEAPSSVHHLPLLDDAKKNCENKEVQSTSRPEMVTSPCELVVYPNFCHRQVQYDLQDARDPHKNKKKVKCNKAIGSFLCLCDESVQFSRHELCTCATQHISGINLPNMRHRPLTVNETRHVANNKTQYKDTPEAAHKATGCIARKHKTGHTKVAQSSNEAQTDTISESSASSASLRSDGSKTDTTICSLATMNFNDIPRRRRFKVKVLTKANQSTLTDRTPVCDTGMVTDDWWSPIVERRGNDTIRLEKKKGFNVIERQKRELREELQELTGLKELREIRKRSKNIGMTTDGRNVTFRSTTQIIPPVLVPGKDLMSPARYLLESQKYYNELYAFNNRLPPQMAYNYVTQDPKSYDKEKNRSSVGSRRNHHRKTKRLDECYSPRRQASPRKRKTESTKSPDPPRRKHRQDRQSNNSVFLIVCDNVFSKSKLRPFPPDFHFGASTSAFQVEGGWNEDGKSPSIWDLATHTEPSLIKDDSTADVAADSYHRHKQDVTVAAELGLDFYRFSISWSRVLPNGFVDKVNQIGVDYYDKLLDELLAKNIMPMVTMYHWDLPANLQKLGGWTNPTIVEWFTDYTKFLFEKFGGKVQQWITFSDPKEICVNGYGSNSQAPFLNITGVAEYMCTRNLLLAHARTYHLYDADFRKLQKGIVGISIGFVWYDAASDTRDDYEACVDAKQFDWGLYAHPIFSKVGNYPSAVIKNVASKSAEQGYPRSRLLDLSPKEVSLLKGSADFLGVNAFTTKMAYRDASIEGMYPTPSFMDDMGSVLVKDPSWPQSQSSWLQEVPWGFFKLLMELKSEYDNPPMYITANGWSTAGGLLDEDRINYMRTYLNALLDAVDEGCDIRGYTMWSLIDTFEWRRGYLDKFGLYEVDFSSPEKTRTPRKSSFIYKEIIRSKILDPDFEPEKFIVEVSRTVDSQERR